MIKKLPVLVFTIIFFISGCGYKPIYRANNPDNFKFSEINLNEDKKINQEILDFLSLEEAKGDNDYPILFITSNYTTDETSKDSKGQVITYRSAINVTLDIINSKSQKITRNFNKTTSYNNQNSKFKLTKNQIQIRSNLIKSISEEIFRFLNIR